MKLRTYQQNLKSNIHDAWSVSDNVLGVLPTGGGKTVIFGDILANWSDGYAWAIAHRQELVGQISCALGTFGIEHQIIAPKNVIKWICKLHVEKFGRPFYNPQGSVIAAGVDTLLRRYHQFERCVSGAGLWVMDEAHHLLKSNKWGKAVELFPNAKGLGVTATPLRADGYGLGSHADGVFDEMVIGPTGRDLINMGFLCDYKVYAPQSDIDLSHVAISSTTGDYAKTQLVKEMRKSRIIGDVVKEYNERARGKLGVTFVTDVQTAKDLAAQFTASGVPAAALSAKTPDRERQAAVRDLARGKLWQLVNVDLFGEGFDLPAIEVIQFARPTESYSLFCQQFGRSLRIMEGKEHAIIIDHVNNTLRMALKYGMPDTPPEWTLDRRDRRKSTQASDALPLKACPGCTAVYMATLKACPECGFTPIPTVRSGPEHVDGDLTELDVTALRALQADIDKVDQDPQEVRKRMEAAGAPAIAAAGAAKQHRLRQESQSVLRQAICSWAGYQRAIGRSDSESYKEFYFKFGVDVLSAQALGRKESTELTRRVINDFRRLGEVLGRSGRCA